MEIEEDTLETVKVICYTVEPIIEKEKSWFYK